MATWNNDEDLFELIKGELFVAVIGDILGRNLGIGTSFCRRISSRSGQTCVSWAEQ